MTGSATTPATPGAAAPVPTVDPVPPVDPELADGPDDTPEEFAARLDVDPDRDGVKG